MRDGVPLRAAAVLFGSARRLESEMPQCLLRVARFRGVDRSEFLDNRQFFGNAFALLASSERFLTDTIPIASRFEPGRVQRIDEPLYPPLAVREAVANALCQRDYAMGGGSVGLAVYDDRLEVTSTGPVALRPDARRPFRAARIKTVESACCADVLPARSHRAMGPRYAQNGATGNRRRIATS